MNRRKWAVLAAAVSIGALCLSGCARWLLPSRGDTSRTGQTEAAAAHFSKEKFWSGEATGDAALMKDKAETMTSEELLAYQSPHHEWMTDQYKRQLSQEQTLIYQAILYASDQGFPYLDFPAEWAQEQENLWDIYSYVALDSPLVESNVRESTWTAEKGSIQLENPAFSEVFLNKKRQAVEKAETIVAAMPDSNRTSQEKARYLYDYLTAYCVYEEYEDAASCQSYLYDALCEGRSICDGFSNALSLLYQCASIESFEKMRLGTAVTAPEKDSSTDRIDRRRGHVWVSAEIEGVYYNFDPTFDIGEENVSRAALSPLWFMFPDGDEEHKPVFGGGVLPACTAGEVGALVRDMTAGKADTADSLTPRVMDILEDNYWADQSYARIWFDTAPGKPLVRALIDDVSERIGEKDWPNWMLIYRQQDHLLVISICMVYDGADAPDSVIRHASEQLRQFNADGFGYAVVQFDVEDGEASGRALLDDLRDAVEAAGIDTPVYGDSFESSDGDFRYWQYWLRKPFPAAG